MSYQATNLSDLRDSSSCATCKTDVEISRAAIHGPPDSLYSHHVRSNSYPDKAGPYKEELRAAKVRLNRLRTTIALLEAEKSRLEGIVEKYEVILHPIRIAPADVLRKIFYFCVDRIEGQVDVPPELRSSLVPSRMPWVLGQICRNWRNLACSTPQLWTNVSLSIRPEAPSRKSVSTDVPRLGLQLYRSQALPLSVSIFCDDTTPQGGMFSRPQHFTTETSLDIHPLLVLVCSFSQRWKHLHVRGSSQGVQYVFSTRGFLPQLESLTMDLDRIPDQATTCFEFAPRLTSISFHTLTLTTLPLPWNQIQVFHFKRRISSPSSFSTSWNTDSSRLYDMIRRLTNVQVCDLFFDRGFSVSEIKGAMLNSRASLFGPNPAMLSLATLILAGSPSTDPSTGQERGDAVIPHFLGAISMPKLSHLQIISPFTGWGELLTFIRRPQCKLSTLTIPQSKSLSPKILNDVLSSLPDLKTLEIGIIGGARNDHISTFTSPVVPNLNKLTIVPELGTGSSYDASVMVDMLIHRWNWEAKDTGGTSRLRFVSLDRRITDKPSRQRLNTLISQGMVIVERDSRERVRMD